MTTNVIKILDTYQYMFYVGLARPSFIKYFSEKKGPIKEYFTIYL